MSRVLEIIIWWCPLFTRVNISSITKESMYLLIKHRFNYFIRKIFRRTLITHDGYFSNVTLKYYHQKNISAVSRNLVKRLLFKVPWWRFGQLEAVTQSSFIKTVFLKISEKSHENTCTGVNLVYIENSPVNLGEFFM